MPQCCIPEPHLPSTPLSVLIACWSCGRNSPSSLLARSRLSRVEQVKHETILVGGFNSCGCVHACDCDCASTLTLLWSMDYFKQMHESCMLYIRPEIYCIQRFAPLICGASYVCVRLWDIYSGILFIAMYCSVSEARCFSLPTFLLNLDSKPTGLALPWPEVSTWP